MLQPNHHLIRYSLVVMARMNDLDSKAWLVDVLARLPDIHRSAVRAV